MMNKCGMVSIMLFLFAGTFVTSVNAQTTPVSIDIGAHQVDLGTAGSTYTFDVFVDSVNEHVNGFEFQLEIAGQLAGPKFLASNTASFRSTSSALTVNIANPTPDEDAVNRPTIGIPQSASGDRYIDYAVGVYDGDNVVINGHQFLGTVTLDLSGLDATVDKYRYGLTLGSGSGFAVNTDVNQEFPASSDPDFEAIHGSIAFVSNPIVVWSGGGADNSLLNFSNWLYQAAPLAGDALQFEGSTRTSVTFDQNADTSYFGITFNDGADSFTLSGTGIGLLNGGGITNKSANAQTVGLDITLADAATPTVTNTFDAQAGDQNFTGNITIGANGILVFTDSNIDTTNDTTIADTTNINAISGTITGPATSTVRNTAGILELSNGAALSDDVNIQLDGGTLSLAFDSTAYTAPSDSPIASSNNESVGSITAAVESVINLHNGILTLTGASTLNGTITDTLADNITDIPADPNGADIGKAGGLAINTNAAVTISGNNDYSLGTIIGNNSSNVLLGTSATAPTVTAAHNNAFGDGGIIFNNGTLISDDNARTLANAITIGGPVIFDGSKLTLTGGVSLIGDPDGADFGSDVSDNARTLTVKNTTEIFSSLDTMQFDSTVNMGAGDFVSHDIDLIKAGNGRLILSGNNDNASTNFTVNAGVLEVNNGSAIGDTKTVALTGAGTSLVVTGSETIGALTGSSTSTVDIATGQTLTTGADSDDFNTFSGKLAGTGIFKVAADATDDHPGVVELAGNSNAFAGDIDVTSGVLLVSGIVGPSSGSAVDVNVGTAGILAGGVLAGDSTGNGVINGNVTIGNGGGNGGMPNGELALATSSADSIDKLAINGNLTMNQDSTMIVQIDDDTSYDQLTVTGTVLFNSGANIEIDQMDGGSTINPEVTYNFIIGSSGVTVDVANLNINSNIAGVGFELPAGYTNGGAVLALTSFTITELTWDAGGDATNWSSNANWDNTDQGILNRDNVGAGLAFAGTGATVKADDGAGGNYDYSGMTYINFNAGAGAFTLTGGQLTLANTTEAAITNNSSNTQTIENAIVVPTLGLDINSNSGDIELTGILSGGGGVFINGSSDDTIQVHYRNANTYTGNTTIQSGTLTVNSSGSVAGNMVLDGGTLVLKTNSPMSDATKTLTINSGTLSGAGDTAGDRTLSNDYTVAGDFTISGNRRLMLDGAGTFTNADVTITVDSDKADLNGVVTGTKLQKAGVGKLYLGAASNVFDDVVVNDGRVILNVADALIASTNGSTFTDVNLTGTGEFKLNFDNTIGNLGGTTSTNVIMQDNVDGDDDITNLVLAGDGTATFSGVISSLNVAGDGLGLGGLTYIGSGTQTLAGINTYTGDTTVASSATGTLAITGSVLGDVILQTGSGTLQLGDNAMADNTTLFIQGGNLGASETASIGALVNVDVTNNFAFTGTNALTLNGSVNLNDAARTIDVTNTTNPLTLAGLITSTGSIEKTGAGQLNLTHDNGVGNSGFSGGVTLTAGTLGIGDNNALGTGTFTINGGTVTALGDGVVDNAVVVGGDFEIAGTNSATLGSSVTLTGTRTIDVTTTGANTTTTLKDATGGGLIKTGAGTLTLTAGGMSTNSFTNGITVSDGLLKINHANATSDTDDLTLNGSGSVAINDDTTVDILNGTGSGTLAIGSSSTLTANSGSVANVISGDGSLAKTSAGTLTLSGDNSFTGGVALNNGTLILGSNTALGNSTSSALTVNGGSLEAGSTLSGAVANNVSMSSNLTVAGSNNLTLSGIISDATTGHGVVKQGSGTLTLAGANTYAANTDVQAGGLALSNGAAINNDASITLYDGTNLLLNNSETIGTLISEAGDTSSTVTLGANTLTLNNLSDDTYNGTISGSGGLALQGAASSFTLTGVNDYTGSTLVTGTELVLDNTAGNALATSDITLGALGTLSILSDESIKSLASSAADSDVDLGSSTLTITGLTSDQVFAGIIHNDSDGSLTYSSDNKLTLSNTNTYTGLTTVEQGTLEITGKLSNSQQINITSGILDVSNDGGDALADTATVTVTGGTFDVTDNEAITKVVVDAAGTLNLDSTLSLERDATDMSTDFVESTISGTVTGTGDLTVANYAHLNLESTTSTDVTVKANGLLNLRGSAGDVVIENGGEFATYGTGMNHILTTAQMDSFTLNSGANFLVDIDVSTLTGDQITVANDFVLIDGAIFNISDIKTNQPSAIGDAFTLATIGGSLLDAASAGNVRTGDITSSVQLTEDFVDYSFTLNVSQDGGNTILTLTAGAVSEYVWDGGGDATNWSDNANWKDDETVGFDVLGKSLTFQDATADTSVIADGGAYSNINSIKFNTSNADSSFTLSGNELTLNTNANIVNNDNNHNTHIVNNDIKLGGQLYVAANQGDLQLGGIIDTTASGHNATFQGEQNTDVTGTIVGDGSVTKKGNGTVILSTANTYAGGTTLQAGTIVLGSSSVLDMADAIVSGPVGKGTLTIQGGTLEADDTNLGVGEVITVANELLISGNFTTSGDNLNLSGNGSLDGNDRQITVTNAITEFSGDLSNGSITKTGSGELLLTGSSDLAKLTINEGSVVLDGGNTVLDNGVVVHLNESTTANASVLELSSDATIGSLTSDADESVTVDLNSSTLTIAGSNLLADATYNGVITNNGGGNLLFTGGFTQTLTGDNTYTGTTTVNATGTLEIAGSVASHVTLTAGTLLLADAAMSDANKVLTINGGNIGTTGGAATIDNALTVGSTVTVVGTDALNLTGDINLGGADRTFDIQDATQTTTLGTNGEDQTDTSATSGITKSGDGTLALAGNFKYTGDTAVNQGELAITTGSVAGNVILSDGKLTLGNDTAIDTTKSLTLNGGTLNLTGSDANDDRTITNNVIIGSDDNATTVAITGNDATFTTGTFALGDGILTHTLDVDNNTAITSAITGSNGLEKAGAGTLTLSGNNAGYTGDTTLSDGTLNVNSATALGSGSLVANGGVLSTTIDGLTVANNITLSSDLTFTGANGNDLTLSGVIDDGSGGTSAQALNKTGENVLSLTGVSNFTALNIKGGGVILDATGASALTSDTAVTLDSTTATATFEPTLYVNSDETIGTLKGDAASTISLNNANLTVTQNTDQTFAGTITMPGSATFGVLTKSGAAKLILSGDTIVTNLAVNQGTLELAGTLNDNVEVEMTNTGNLQLDAAQTVQSLSGTGGTVALGTNTLTINDDSKDLGFGGSFIGTGTVDKIGDGILSLTGVSTFSGNTLLNDGTLVLNATAGSALANSSLTVADNTTLQLGSDETIKSLTGTSNASVDLGADNTLTVSGQTGSTIFAGVISQTDDMDNMTTGKFTYAGSADSMLTLNNINTFTGMTTVSSGTVYLDGSSIMGSVLAGDVTVGGTGILSGSDNLTDGNLIINSGGVFKPGYTGNESTVNSVTIGGNATFNNGSNIIVSAVYSETGTVGYNVLEATNTNFASQTVVNIQGNMAVFSGSVVNLTVVNDDLAVETDRLALFVIKDGGLAEDGTTIDAAFTTASLEDLTAMTLVVPGLIDAHLAAGQADDGSTVIYAVLDSLINFEELSGTSESMNTSLGHALDLVYLAGKAGNADALAFINRLKALDKVKIEKFIDEVNSGTQGSTFAGQTVIQLVQTFNHVLSNHLASRRSNMPIFAQQDANAQTSMLAGLTDDPHTLAQVAANEQQPQDQQVREATPINEWAAFAKIYGVFSNQDTTSSRAGYSSSGVGVQFGMDYQVNENLIVGLAFDYASTTIDQDNNLGDIDVNSFRIGPFASWYNEAWFVDANLTFGLHTNDSTRRDTLGSYDASYDSNDVSVYLGGGYQYKLDESWTLTPTASLRYSYYNRDAYTESNGGAAYDSYSTNRLYTRLGAKLSYQLKTMDMLFIPEVVLGWEHEYLNEHDPVAASYFGTGVFAVSTNTPDSDSVFFGLGLTAVIDERWSTFVRYDGSVSENGDTHAVTGGVRFDF